jgi:hypothetical protein
MIRSGRRPGSASRRRPSAEATQAFLKDATARNVRPGTLKNLRVLLSDLQRYAERKGIQLVKGLDTEKVRESARAGPSRR